jgi:hypothetical protein
LEFGDQGLVVLQALDQAGERALREVNLLGELLDAAMSLRRVGESAENLVFGEGEAVLSLEAVFEGLTDAGVLGLELIPSVEKLISICVVRGHLASLLLPSANGIIAKVACT